MKETVTVNIGSEVFILDNDACRALQNYLDDVRSRLPEEDGETMDDIEIRIAEIFRERVCSPMRVVTLDLVRSTIARLGAPRNSESATAPRNRRTKRRPSRPAGSTARAPTARLPASAAASAHSSTPTPR